MKQHYTGLDGLRGLAAGAVMLMHEIGIFRAGLGPQLHAYIAVDLFFILSGFVLAYAYDGRLDRGMTWLEFMKIRAIRLYPLLAAATLFSAGVTVIKFVVRGTVDPGESLWLLPAGLSLFPASLFMGAPHPFSSEFDLIPFGGPAWSLLFEFVGSALFATGMRRMGRRAVPIFLVGAIALCGFAIAADGTSALGRAGYVGVPAGLFRVGIPFAIGIFLFRHRIPDMLPRSPVIFSVIAGGVLCVLPIGISPAFDLTCIFLFFPVLISFAAQPVHSDRLRKTFTVLGALSYPLYLLHVPVSRMIGFLAKALFPKVGANMLIILSMIASVAVSWLMLKLFDEPIRRWLTRLGSSPRPLANLPHPG
uniref:acyltransferase family protein n=1 Tax=uncultured Sphingomonas sp. TaxID=158754 RepID=UPI0035C9E53A